jgi:predicted nucleic acid-binding protein
MLCGDFPTWVLATPDFEEAAAFFNRCRSQGIQGGHIDFLLCAVAWRRAMAILTTDKDFVTFARLLPIHLHEIR